MKFSRVCRMLVWTIAIALAVVSAGCLDGEKSVEATYDAKTDSFAYLVVYQHLRSSQNLNYSPGSTQPATDQSAIDAFQRDAAYLGNLYKNRDSLILVPPLPLPIGGDILNPAADGAILKLPDNSVGSVPLGDDHGGIPVTKSPIPLDQIQIIPGSLFFADKNNLCYYEQISLPGKIVDQLLAMEESDLRQQVIEKIGDESMRRQNGGAPLSWADATAQLVDLINGVEPASQPATDAAASQPATDAANSTPLPFSDESLNAIKGLVTSGQPFVHRRGAVFSAQVPLAEADVNGLLAMVNKARQAMRAQNDNGLDATEFRAIDKTTVEISIDLIKWLNAASKIQANPVSTDPKEAMASTEMATLAPDLIPVDKNLMLQQVLDGFRAGTLKGNPSPLPVAAGTGLGELQPTTQDTTMP